MFGKSANVLEAVVCERVCLGYARDHQPCIIFMDEIDAIGGRRFSEGSSADREIQRTLMEVLIVSYYQLNISCMCTCR